MNKHLHRIIFNKARGLFMVVQETASSVGGSVKGAAQGSSPAGLVVTLEAIRFAVLCACGVMAGLSPLAQAQIVADPAAAANQRAIILNTANGLPLVNIQTPSAAGVSRNIYNRFDVSAGGAVLNNSRTNVQTQLGGFIQGNPMLATGSARVILNEVNSANPSQLRGYVEVGGQRAEVIIANPAGIAVDGGGFINASRVTLTTGTPLLNALSGGSLEGYRVQRGTISIDGAGLDTGTADYTGILARAVQANAGVWARELKVVTGANDVDAAQAVVTPTAGTGTAPTFALDVAKLGGMYANHIFLIGTEAGVGVRNAGVIGATQGDLVLQTNGWLTSSGTLQGQTNTALQATGVSNSGQAVAGQTLTIATPGVLDNSAGTLSAQRLDVSAASLVNRGGVIEQTGSQGLVLQSASLSNAEGGQIGQLPTPSSTAGTSNTGATTPTTTPTTPSTTPTAASSGTTGSGTASTATPTTVPVAPVVLADGLLDIAGSLNNDAGRISAAGGLDLTSHSGLNNDGGTLRLRQLTVTGGNLGNQGGTLATSGDMRLNTGQIDNRAGTLSATGQLHIDAQGLDNTGGEIVQTGTADTVIRVDQGTFDNTRGRLASNAANLSITAAGLLNTDGKFEHAGTGSLSLATGSFGGARSQLTSNGNLQAVITGSLNNTSGSLTAAQVQINAASLDNSAGRIVQTGAGATSIQTTGLLDNRTGTIASNGQTSLNAASIDNRSGTVQTSGSAALTLLAANTLDNGQGQITAGGALQATAGQLQNTSGLIAANGAVQLTTATLDNTGGTIASVKDQLGITTTGTLANDAGRLQALGDVALSSGMLGNAGGSISGQNLTIATHGAALGNAGGTIAAVQNATLVTGALNNDAGLVQAGGDLSIDTGGQTLTNTGAARYANGQGGITSQGTLTLDTGDLNNASGFIGAKGQLSATAAQVANTAGGLIVGQSALAFSSTGFDNRGGQVQAVGDIAIDAGPGALDNTASLIRSGGAVRLAAASIVNRNTLGTDQGVEGQDVTLHASTLANDSGAVRADRDLTIATTGTLGNASGLLSAGRAATLQAASLVNTGGTVIGSTAVTLNAGTIGGDGKLLSQGDMAFNTTADFSNSSEVIANGNLTFSSTANLTNSGKLQAGNVLTVAAANIDNTATGEMSGTTTRVTATGTLTNRGLIDGQATEINAGTLTNIGTGRLYGDHLSIQAGTINNLAETIGTVTKAGTIAARERLDIGVGTLNNSDGALIFSAGAGADALNIGGALDANRHATGAAAAVNNSGATIESLGGLTIRAADIVNGNPDFAFYVADKPGTTETTEYITPQGLYTAADLAWVVQAGTWQPAGHGGYVYEPRSGFNTWTGVYGQGLLVPKGSAYANTAYAPYYGSADAYRATHEEEGPLGTDATIVVPEKFAYTAADPIWQLFGVTPPTGAPPDYPRPTGYQDATWGYIPPDPADLAAWTALAQPWLDLQAKLDTFRTTVDSTAISFSGLRSYTQSTAEAIITRSTPGRILSGGDVTLDASNSLVNAQSTIIAGGALRATGKALDNRALTVDAPAQRTGTAYAWRHYDEGCGSFSGCDYSYDAYGDSPYQQTVPKTLTVGVSVSLQYQSPGAQGSGTQLGALANASAGASAGSAGAAQASVRNGSIVQVTANANAPGASGGAAQVRTVPVAFNLPTASLYNINTNPSGHYLVETDPRFANYRNWLGSDYLLNALGLDPNTTQKRLGDGFYEQRLVNEQIMQLTGQRYLADYRSDEAQYRALMEGGLTFARAWGLVPGIALTAEQMAQLTSDIVWLVEQTVTLADGSTQRVLVPQVYVRVRPGDIDGTGTLLAGKNVDIQVTGDLTNSGTIAGRQIVRLDADNVRNLGGRIDGASVDIKAQTDLDNIGGTISAADRLTLHAGRDINVVTTTGSATNQVAGNGSLNTFGYTGIDRVAGLYVTNPGGVLVASADRDVNLIGAVIDNSGKGSQTTITAQRDIKLGAVTTGSSSDQTRDDSNFLRYSQTQDVGTRITGGGSVQLNAGRDIVGTGAELQAGGALGIVALNDVKLGAGSSTYNFGASLTTNESDMFGSTSTREQRTTSQSNAIASTLSGGSVNVLAGNDATLEGVKIDAQGDASVVAMNRLIVGPAYNTSTDSYSYESTSTGLGMGSRTQADQLAQSTLQRTEISANNVTLRSLEGDAYVSGTTLNAPGTVTLGAANGRLYLDGAQTQTTTSHQSSSSDLLMQEAKGEGGTEQVTNYNQINAGRIVFDAPAITAQIGSRDSLAQLAQQPGMGWMNQLSTDPALGGKVDWVTIQDASSHWQYQQQGLTPAAAALVTVAVGYFTAGMGAEFAGAVGMSTTTTAGAAFAGAASAAITALGSRVVIAFAAHPGDLGAVLQDLGSSDSVKGLVSAILTGGALGALDLNALGQATAGGGAQSFPTQLAQNIQGSLARAVINTAVFGGSLEDNIKANLLTSLIDTVAAQGAFEIGNLTQDGVLDDFANKLAHAIAGCATAALRTNGNCSAGALGAVIGELAAESYGSKADTVQFASMISALVATATGMNADDVMLASQAGGNAAANNYVSHSPFAGVSEIAAKENARLTAACEPGCTAEDFVRIDQQVAAVERGASLAEVARRGLFTPEQAQQLAQTLIELVPIYGTGESVLQLITGHSSLTGEEANRIWAAVGLVPLAGGMVRKVGEPAVETLVSVLRALDGPVFKTTKEATQAAEALGYKRINEFVNGQAVYTDGKRYISRDVDGHNGGTWKLANSVKSLGSKETRIGTFNADLTVKIGD